MTDAFLEFSDVFIEDMGCMNRGRVKLSDSNVVFKNEKTGKVTTVPTSELASAEWTRLANQPALRLTFEAPDDEEKGSQLQRQNLRIGGLREQDQEKIGRFVEDNWNKKLKDRELSVKGWNYGETKLKGPTLDFLVDSKLAFEVPLQNVSKCTAAKNEATLEFHQNDDAPVGLMEMRFFMAEEDQGEERVEAFRQMIMKFAGIEAESGQAVATLEQILCTTPRGRYDIKVYPNHLSLHGKTYDYKIPVKTITRLFLVPHKDGRHMYFVISVNPPIRQGQTRYHYLVLEFLKEERVELELGMSQEQLDELFKGKLERELSGGVYEVVSKIFRVLVNMRITVPGNFVGHSGTPAVQCAHKQASGHLYPLEKGFLYIHKPPMYVRFEEVSSVHFARSDVSTRSFDFEIELKTGQTLVFNSVEKEEYNKLFDFVQNKGLRIRNAKKLDKNYAEDRFAGSDDDIDPYKARLKASETVKAEGKTKMSGGGDSDDSEDEDSDYDLDKDLAKRREIRRELSEGSESEPDEEWDSNPEDESEEGEGESDGGSAAEEKKAKKREKKAKKAEKEGKEGKDGDKKSKRSKKDPNAPKRGQSAYFLWMNENRSTIKREGDSVADTARRGGEMWKTMSADDKTEWENKAAKDKERYEREMKEYKKNGGGSAPAASSSSSKKKTTSSPQKGVKSKEFVESSDESSDDDAPLKKGAKSGSDESGDGDSESD